MFPLYFLDIRVKECESVINRVNFKCFIRYYRIAAMAIVRLA